MIALARKSEGVIPVVPSYRKPVVTGVKGSSSVTVTDGIPFTPALAATLKAAIKAQQAAIASGKVVLPEKTLSSVGEPVTEAPELMDVKPKRSPGKRQVQMRATGKVPSPPVKKAAKVQKPAVKATVKATKPSNVKAPEASGNVWSENGKTIQVVWKQRVSRRQVNTVKVMRSEGYEQWFLDNPPEGLGYKEIVSDVDTAYGLVSVTRKTVVRIGNLDVNLGGTVREIIRVPVGKHDRQREQGLLQQARSSFSRTPTSAKDRIQTLTTLFVQPTPSKEIKAPWVEEASTVTVTKADSEALGYDNPGRLSRIRHRAYIQRCNPRLLRLANRTLPQGRVTVLTPAYANESVNKQLLRNMTVAALKGLNEEHKEQRLFYSVRTVDVAASTAGDELPAVDEAAAQIERLESFNQALISKVPLTAEEIQQAAFNAMHHRVDLRTKAQKAREEHAEQRKWEDQQTKEWIGLEIKERNKLQMQTAFEMLEMSRHEREVDALLDDRIQDQYRLTAWLQSRAVVNPYEDERYQQWLMRRAGRGYFNERKLETLDDASYAAWLYDNAGDQYHLDRWLHLNHTPRVEDESPPVYNGDNVVCMMEWRHRNKKQGADDKASAKIGGKTIAALKLNPPKTSDVIITEQIMSDERKANDPTVDKSITSFGKVVKDVRQIIGKFNQQEGMGLYLPTYLLPVK